MVTTQEELLKAMKYLNKRAMSCDVTGTPPPKAVVKALSEDMTIEEFNENIVPQLDYENKHKLGSMLRQYNYNKKHPKKSLKLSKEVAEFFNEKKGNKSVDEFVMELLKLYN